MIRDIDTGKVYENTANGQKTITLSETAESQAGDTALIYPANINYDEIRPNGLQAEPHVKAALKHLETAIDKLKGDLEHPSIEVEEHEYHDLCNIKKLLFNLDTRITYITTENVADIDHADEDQVKQEIETLRDEYRE